jgi:hypothetical protein
MPGTPPSGTVAIVDGATTVEDDGASVVTVLIVVDVVDVVVVSRAESASERPGPPIVVVGLVSTLESSPVSSFPLQPLPASSPSVTSDAITMPWVLLLGRLRICPV